MPPRPDPSVPDPQPDYRTIFDLTADAICVYDQATGEILDTNRANCELHGYTIDEIRARGITGMSAPREPYTVERATGYVRRAAAGEPQRYEWATVTRSGEEIVWDTLLMPTSLQGRPVLVTVARDIRALKASEAALRRANEELEGRVAERSAEAEAANAALRGKVAELEGAREQLIQRTRELEGVFRTLPDLYFRLDAHGTILEHRGGREAGLSDEAYRAFGQRIQDVLFPALGDYFRAAHPVGEVTCIEAARTTEGGERDYEARLLPLADGTAIAIVRDITDRKRAERALREREEHFRALIENAHDITCILDLDGVMTYQSPSLQRLLGWDPGEVIGRSAWDFIHPEDVDTVTSAIREVVENPGVARSAEYRFRHRDGSWRMLEAIGRILSVDSPELGVVSNVRDVTERWQAEAALQVAIREAEAAREASERANHEKSEFLSRMSHELRTPMNSILGFAQILGDLELAPEDHRAVNHILSAGEHLLKLINEVLDIARIEAGRQQLSLEPVQVGGVVREAIDLVRPLALSRGIRVTDAVGPAARRYVRADRQRLAQVLLNLLSNAIKYNRPAGSVRITCDEGGDGRLRVHVADDGIGIPADRREQLFTPFARLGAEQSVIEGTGLGLTLSRRLVEAMGGELYLERTGERGSVFCAALAEEEDPLASAALPEPAADSGGGEAARPPATLLYIEDNLANLSLIERVLLSRPEWRLLPALQGQLGIELAREHVPDLILLDLHLPDLSGEEVLRELRADVRTGGIPVVVVSADATPRTVERLRAAGAEAYLTKPLNVKQFVATIEHTLAGPAERA